MVYEKFPEYNQCSTYIKKTLNFSLKYQSMYTQDFINIKRTNAQNYYPRNSKGVRSFVSGTRVINQISLIT